MSRAGVAHQVDGEGRDVRRIAVGTGREITAHVVAEAFAQLAGVAEDVVGHPRGRARHHAVRGDAVALQGVRGAPGEAEDPGLRGRVGRDVGHAVERAAREEDEAARALRDHHLGRGLRAREVALEVDVDDVVPLLFADLPQVLRHRDAGCARDRVEPAERVDRGLHRGPPTVHRRDVDRGRHCLAAGRDDLGHHCVRGLGRAGAIAVDRTAVVGNHHAPRPLRLRRARSPARCPGRRRSPPRPGLRGACSPK